MRDLQNENDYFDELGIKSGYDRNEQTLNSIFSSSDTVSECVNTITRLYNQFYNENYITENEVEELQKCIQILEKNNATDGYAYNTGIKLLKQLGLDNDNSEFSLRIREDGPRVTTYTTITGDTKDELFDKVYVYFKSHQYGTLVERYIDNPNDAEEYREWLENQDFDELWYKHASGRDFD